MDVIFIMQTLLYLNLLQYGTVTYVKIGLLADHWHFLCDQFNYNTLHLSIN